MPNLRTPGLCLRRLTSERLWLCIALVGFVLLFERWTVLEVKDGEVVVSRISFWCHKSEIKKAKASEIGEVSLYAVGGLPPRLTPSDLIIWKVAEGGEYLTIFYVLSENNRFSGWQRKAWDIDRLKVAIANGTYCKISRCDSFRWLMLGVISLVVYGYKRSRRLELSHHAKELQTQTEKKAAKLSSSGYHFRFRRRKKRGR